MAGTEFYTWELSGWKGLNSEPNLEDKDPHYVDDCQNVDFDEAGLITKRRGLERVPVSISGRINLILDFYSQQGFKDVNDKHRIIVIAGTNLYIFKEDYSIDDQFVVPNIMHYGVISDNGVCYTSNENDASIPQMLFHV
jgi:hypothetical protein